MSHRAAVNGRQSLSRIALLLLGAALCALLYLGTLELGSNRSRDEPRRKSIVSLGSVPSPSLLRAADGGSAAPGRDEGSESKGEGRPSEMESDEGEGGAAPTEGGEEAAPASGESYTPSTSPPSGDGSAEAAPKENPPIESTPGQ